MPDRYVVMGNPVGHSRSPSIHARFAAQTAEAIEYRALLVAPGGLAAAVAAFRAEGGKGANITLPFKEDAFALAGEVSARARAAGAVNTLIFSASAIVGDNTDGCGLTRDLAGNLGFGVRGRRVLLLGAGGAARGVLLPLLEEQPALLVVANRTIGKAHQMVGRIATGDTRPVTACDYEGLAGQSFDLVINATSTGLTDAALPLPTHLFAPGSIAYEMLYGRQTPFMRQALEQGAARVSDGLGMLVEQAAESFFLWRGVRPLTAPVLAEMRAA